MKKMDEAKMWLERAVNDNPWKTADDKAVCMKMGLFMIKTRNFKLHLSNFPQGPSCSSKVSARARRTIRQMQLKVSC